MAPRNKKPKTVAEIGRLGGKANTPAQMAARRRNVKKAGGRPQEYVVQKGGKAREVLVLRRSPSVPTGLVLQHVLSARALVVLGQWIRDNHPTFVVTAFRDGIVTLTEGA